MCLGSRKDSKALYLLWWWWMFCIDQCHQLSNIIPAKTNPHDKKLNLFNAFDSCLLFLCFSTPDLKICNWKWTCHTDGRSLRNWLVSSLVPVFLLSKTWEQYTDVFQYRYCWPVRWSVNTSTIWIKVYLSQTTTRLSSLFPRNCQTTQQPNHL